MIIDKDYEISFKQIKSEEGAPVSHRGEIEIDDIDDFLGGEGGSGGSSTPNPESQPLASRLSLS